MINRLYLAKASLAEIGRAFLSFAILACLFLAPATEAGKLRVVASIPDLGVMAGTIGGDSIEVVTLASGREDLHGVPARPSFIPKLNWADILLTMGLDAEHAWLPALAAESRNLQVMEDHQGWIEVYQGVELLDIPEIISRSEGEQHPEGNPHYNVGPQCGPIMARNIAEALADADPERAEHYLANAQEYRSELEKLADSLKAAGSDLAGIAIVSYHPDVAYLAEFYGMRVIGSLEPKAGIEPSAGHVAELARKAKSADVKLALYHQAQSGRLPEEFASRIGAAAVQFANMVGAKKEIKTFRQLQRYNLRVLLEGLSEVEATK